MIYPDVPGTLSTCFVPPTEASVTLPQIVTDELARQLYSRGLYSLLDGRLTARCREVSKSRDSGLDFYNRFEI